MPAEALSGTDTERVARVVSEHPHAGALGRLAFRVLSRQAEGGSLFSGKKYMRRQARAYGVTRSVAETPVGNLLQVLERGPDSDLERALVGGFALAGFELALAQGLGSEVEPHPEPLGDGDGEPGNLSSDSLGPPSETDSGDSLLPPGLPPAGGGDAGADIDGPEALCRKFVEHLDWLTLATPYQLQPLVPLILTGTAIRHLAAALRHAVVQEQGLSGEGDAGARARVAVRVALLARLPTHARCGDVLRAALDDPFTRALVDISFPGAADTTAVPTPSAPPAALAVGADEASEHETPGAGGGTVGSDDAPGGRGSAPGLPEDRVDAAYGRAPAGPIGGALRWLSGWALLSWLVSGALALLGVRRQGSFSLEPAGVRVLAETRAAGRVWSELDEVIRLDELRFGRRHVRYPGLRRLLGLLGFCLGAVVGAFMLFDGLAVMERGLMLAGACVVGAGAALDLVIDVALAGHRGQVALELAGRGRRYCLRNVPLGEADAFMDALASRGAPRLVGGQRSAASEQGVVVGDGPAPT